MLKNIILNMTQKKLIVVWFILALFIIIDFTSRLTDYDSVSKANISLEKIEQNSILMLEQKEAESIIAALNRYQVQNESKLKSHEIMSEAEQNAQRGNLNQLYAGNIQFRLIGVFDKSELFAVIQQKDVSLNEYELIKIGPSEKLKNYQVVKIYPDKITLLSDDNRQITLFLYSKLEQNT